MKTLRVLLTVTATVGALCAVTSGQARQDADMIVSGGIVVTMDGARTIVSDGSVAVKADVIVAVGPRAELESRYRASETIDARGRLVLPAIP